MTLDALMDPAIDTTLDGAATTVLIVELDPIIRNLLCKILEREGYVGLAAGSALEALMLSRERREPIHLLVTEVGLEGISGIDLARRMSTLRPGIKILFTSGYLDPAIGLSSLSGSGRAFLPKPFTSHELTAKVRELLDS